MHFLGMLLCCVPFKGIRALRYHKSSCFLHLSDPTEQEIELTIAISVDYITHRGQQVCVASICWLVILPLTILVVVKLLDLDSELWEQKHQ